MLLGISTGCFWQLDIAEIKILRLLKNLDIDAIELVFAYPQELFDFRPTREDIAFLRSKKYVSLHAPFRETEYSQDAKSKRALSALNSLALKAKAQNVVFHAETITDFSLFGSVDFTPLAENLTEKAGVERLVSVRQMRDFLSAHENFGFCFDLGDALVEGITPQDFLALGGKLKEAHIHFPISDGKKLLPHGLPSKTEKTVLEQSASVFSLNAPLLLEGFFNAENSHSAAEELALLRVLAKQ